MMHADSNRSYWPRCLAVFACCCLATELASAQQPLGGVPFTPVLAVDDVEGSFPSANPGGLSDPSLIPWYKGGGTAVGVLLTFFVAWYLIYPWALRRGNIWPVSLFGLCTAAAWFLGWGIGIMVYWEDMNIAPHAPWWREWGLRITCLGLQCIFAFGFWAYWRSEVQSRAS